MSQEIYSGISTVVVADADVATNQDIVLVTCPAGVKMRVKLVSAAFAVLPTAALVDIIERDSSANSETTLADDVDLVTSQTSAEGTNVPLSRDAYLEPGDTLRALLTGVTAGSVEGLNFTCLYEIKQANR